MNPHAIVIGAGVGGLSAAVRLAGQGFRVTVLEQGKRAGGRCGQVSFDGFTFDTGPTLLLMPEVLEETFASVGRRASDYVELTRCDPNYRIHFREGEPLTFSTDLTAMARQLEGVEPGAFGRYLEFLRAGEHQYRVSLERFVGRNFDSVLQFLAPGTLREVFKVKAHKNMYAEVSRYFGDDRLRAALTFQTMYLGISPYESPAVYGLLPYTELAVGIWFPKGGLYAVPKALEQVGRELGVTYRYQTPVRRILVEGEKSSGVELVDGTRLEADVVVCNADLPWAYKHLLPEKASSLPRAESLRYTSSAFMMYLGLSKQYPELLHHNVFFGGDYRGSFEDIFHKRKVPDDPSFYVNVPARTDASLAPEGRDGLYILVPVPNKEAAIDWRTEGPRLREQILSRLEQWGAPGLREHIVAERSFCPDDYANTLNLERGAAFGLSHNFFQVGPFRPANQDPNVRNLFFVGASTQPGTGLPMVMLSARLTTERVLQHTGITPSSVPRLTATHDRGPQANSASPNEVAA